MIMGALGIKASQSRGIINPCGGGIDVAPPDSGRARQLALSLLGREEEA